MSALISSSYACNFPKFPALPVELQTRVWQFALPDPRSIPHVVVMIINFDLSRPKALIPSTKDLEQCRAFVNASDEWMEFLPGIEIRRVRGSNSRSHVLHLMQVSHQARKVACATYRLDIGSIIPEENTSFWHDDEDLVYFHWADTKESEPEAMLYYLTQGGFLPVSGFDRLKHVAFRLDYSLYDYISEDDELIAEDASLWKPFPSMKSLTILLDPSNLHQDWQSGRIALHRPFPDVTIDLCDSTASALEHLTASRLKNQNPGKDVPLVDVLVMQRRRHKMKRG